ncbi:acyltransferase family protein [Butyrivibrio sp. JL13D10]|uniref:acyltransferase family protein n=1 Tax=Butyrivibrio sp. JL13D10 TaxID=3236815 RepID=UPI0038B4BB9F
MSSLQAQKNRVRILDIAKGIGICMIAVYHLVYRQKDGMADQGIRSFIWFIIPFFFIVSGYFYNTAYDNRLEILRHRIITLFVPAAITMCFLHLVGGIYFILFHDYTVKDVINDLIVTFFRPEFTQAYYNGFTGGMLFFQLSPVWFIWAMIWAYLFFYNVSVTAFKSTKNMIIVVTSLIVLGTLLTRLFAPLPWSAGMSPIFALLILIGAWIRKTDLFDKIISINVVFAFFISLFCITVFWILFKVGGNDNIYAGNFGNFGIMTTIVFVGQSVLTGFAYIFLCRIVSMLYFISDIFSWIGKNTMVILLYHCFFGMFIDDALGIHMKPGPYWYIDPLPQEVITKSIIVLVFAILLSCLIVFVRRKVLFYIIENCQNEYVGHLLDTMI